MEKAKWWPWAWRCMPGNFHLCCLNPCFYLTRLLDFIFGWYRQQKWKFSEYFPWWERTCFYNYLLNFWTYEVDSISTFPGKAWSWEANCCHHHIFYSIYIKCYAHKPFLYWCLCFASCFFSIIKQTYLWMVLAQWRMSKSETPIIHYIMLTDSAKNRSYIWIYLILFWDEIEDQYHFMYISL